MPGPSFRDSRVWQEAMKLTANIYKHTAMFPKHELYGLSQQIRRAAVSIPSNIAKGKGIVRTANSLISCCTRGSLLELQTQLLIAEELQYLSQPESESPLLAAERVGRSLSGPINSLSEKVA